MLFINLTLVRPGSRVGRKTQRWGDARGAEEN